MVTIQSRIKEKQLDDFHQVVYTGGFDGIRVRDA